MFFRLLLFVAPVVVFSVTTFAESPVLVHELGNAKKPWTSDQPRFAPRDFQFSVISDNTGTPRPGILGEAFEKVQLLQPSFVMSVGDLIDGYVSTKEELNAQWDEMFSFLKPLTVPFFFVPGNHDVGRQLWHDVYLERVGPTYYYFLYQDVLFLIMNSNDSPDRGTGYGDEQIAWAKDVLEKHKDARWTFMFQHKPFWLSEQEQWAKIAPVLEGRKITIFAGHIHNYLHTQQKNIHYVTLGTTGGGSAMRGPALGEFDHVMWVTVSDDGPKMAALSLDGILPVDLRTPELAKALEAFKRKTAVQGTPLIQSGEQFEAGDFEFTVKNPWTQPLRFQGLVEGQDSLAVSPSAVNVMVPAGETITRKISVRAAAPIPFGELAPLVLHWTGVYDGNNTAPLQLSGKLRMFADSPCPLPAAAAVIVDGKLDDWPALPFLVSQPGDIYTNEQAWKGPQDATFRFGVARDDATLFVAMEVNDDAVTSKGTKLYQDFAVVYARAAAAAEEKVQPVGVVAGLELSDEEILDYEVAAKGTNNREQGARSAAAAEGNTIRYEFAIPLAMLTRADGSPAERIQINPSISDFDESDARLGISLISWRPRWDGGGAYAEAGVFEIK